MQRQRVSRLGGANAKVLQCKAILGGKIVDILYEQGTGAALRARQGITESVLCLGIPNVERLA
jgi:hypothetical protein